MFIRRKRNKSGSTSIQVLEKQGRRNVILSNFGVATDEEELLKLEARAMDFIKAEKRQRESCQLKLCFVNDDTAL